jgi:membrane-bound ClpP family serine protease
MEFLAISLLLLTGIALIVVEVIFIPGTTFVGIIGFVCCSVAVGVSFYYFGNQAGFVTLGISVLTTGLAFWYGLRSNAWNYFALKNTMSSTVGDDQLLPEIGQKGLTVSVLRPVGIAEINGNRMEVCSRMGVIEKNSEVEVVEIKNHKIFVQIV